MDKNVNYWIERWQRSRVFCVENDRIKPKSYLFSAFPKTNIYGFKDGNIRKILAGDFYSRYKRMLGYNVLFPVGYDSLGLKSFMENKKHSNTINDDISLIFKDQMLKLGIGIDSKKEIDLKHNSYLSSLQLTFIELYEKGYIKYGECLAYYDEKTGKYYDLALGNRDLPLKNVNCFYLDISNIFNRLVEKLNELNLDKEVKNKLINYLDEKEGLDVNFYVNNILLTGRVHNPEFLGGASFIVIHPDKVDLEGCVSYDKFKEIEEYLSSGNGCGVFGGCYTINPLTGNKLPIYISVDFKEGIHVGIPAINNIDFDFAEKCGIDIIECVSDGVLCNSDFIDGLSKIEGKEAIIKAFVEADIASSFKYYNKNKIIVSSSDAFGALIPFLMTENKELYSLKSYLPFNLSKKFRPVIDEAIDVPANTINGSINHIFSSGMLSILSLIYDEIGAGYSIFNQDMINELKMWNGIDLMHISIDELFENVFFPICILTILEKEFNVKLPALFHNIKFVKQTYDIDERLLRKFNNNTFDIEKYLDKYSGDSLRLYFLKSKLDEDFIFKEEELIECFNDINKLENFFKKSLVKENNRFEYSVYNLAKECMEYINGNNIYEYVNHIVNFCLVNQNINITRKSGLVLLKLLYPIIPFVMEDIYASVFMGKHLISDDGFYL